MRGLQDRVRERDTNLYRDKLSELYTMRLVSDYAPDRAVDSQSADIAKRHAGQLIELTHRLIHS